MKPATNVLMTTCSRNKAEEYAAILYGCYRRTDADNPEVFMSAAVAILCGYPEEVVRAVCDPRSGLPSKSSFPPNIYELTTACDARMRPILEADRRRRVEEENEADRPAPVDGLAAERRKAFIANWRQKQAVLEAAAAANVETPLETLDARKLHGKHAELVKEALDAKLKRISEQSRSTPMKLSDLALRSLGLSPPAMATVSGRGNMAGEVA